MGIPPPLDLFKRLYIYNVYNLYLFCRSSSSDRAIKFPKDAFSSKLTFQITFVELISRLMIRTKIRVYVCESCIISPPFINDSPMRGFSSSWEEL